MKHPHFARLIWTPAKEHITDYLNSTSIGVMHIVDMYASCNYNQVSLSLLRDNPEQNLSRYEQFVDDVAGTIVAAEYIAQTTLSVLLVIVMAHVKSIGIHYVMLVNSFAMNWVTTAQIHSWWYEEIAKIDPAWRNSDPPHAYISVVNESSQQLFPSLTSCIRLWQRLIAAVQEWYTAARHQSTLFTDFKQSHLQRSTKL